MRRAVAWFVVLSLVAVALIELRNWIATHPQDLPWAEFDFDQPVGRFTAGQIAALRDEPDQCRAMLLGSGTADRAAPERSAGPECGYSDGILVRSGGARIASPAPAGLVTSCPVASALALWDERVVQPAARHHFGEGVAALEHAGSYSCRRLYGRESGGWSEHSTANAVDIVGFRLTDGRTVSVLRDWPSEGEDAAFLREVRDGACGLFTTVLSPDYNAAHADHLHLDSANRGISGWKACR